MEMDILAKNLFRELDRDYPDYRKLDKLLDQGADINVIAGGETVLSWLLFVNREENVVELVSYLLERGADPNLETCEGFNCLFQAILQRNVPVVRVLLEAGANPNCVGSSDDETLLDWAMCEVDLYEMTDAPKETRSKSREIVSLLLKYGGKNRPDLP